MKNIITLLILTFSLNALSCANSMPISTAIFAIENNGAGREKEMNCAKLPDEQCVCFDDIKEWDESELVDNEVLDYIKKVDAVSCVDEKDCDDKFEALVCNGKQEKIKNYDSMEVYCAKEIMKVDGKKLVNSESKKAQRKAEKEAEKELELSNKAAKKALKLSIKNDIKDVNTVAKLRALVEKLIEAGE